MAYYESKRLIWSTKEFSLKEIIEKYSEYLPFLVVITQGYSSSRLEIAADQIFWLRDVTRQRRLVAKNDRGRYFSIPECYKEQLQQLVRIDAEEFIPVGDAITVEELMAKEEARYFKFVGKPSREVVSENNDTCYLEVGCLEMIDIYQEKYLVVHPLFTDEGQYSVGSSKKHFMVHPQLITIPADIPMTLAIAVGMKTTSDRKFFQIMLNMKRFADCCDRDYAKHVAKNAAIMTFAEVPVRTTYEYVELSTLSGSRGEKTGPKLQTHKADSGYSSLSKDASDGTLDYELIVLVPGDERRFSLEERLKTLQEAYRTGRVPADCSTEMSADDLAVGRDAGSRVEEKPKRTSLTAKHVQD